MLRETFAQFRPACLLLLVLTLLTGAAYPATVTLLGNALFPGQAQGSLIRSNGRVLGSRLVGQPFHSPGRFWSRPSATTPAPYNAASSSGSNLGPLNPALAESVEQRVANLRAIGGGAIVPLDLVTVSASGLDPHISPEAALYQVSRVAQARGLPEESVRRLVERRTEPRTLGLLGEPRVNVLLLNMDLDSLVQNRDTSATGN